MESENHHDFDTTIATFAHPRYEIIATGDVYDGESDVRRYFAETRTAFPDQRNELIALHHADDAVIAEFDLLGTHLGPLRFLPATGRTFRCRMTAFFLFEDDHICCERVYFDQTSILRQHGVAHDPARSRAESLRSSVIRSPSAAHWSWACTVATPLRGELSGSRAQGLRERPTRPYGSAVG